MQINKKEILLDTCAWIWIATGNERIKPKIIEYISDKSWLISAISVWEVAMLVSKNRISLSMDIKQWIKKSLTQKQNLNLVPLSPEIAITSCQLDIAHSDPADKIILATALNKNIELITGDKILLKLAPNLDIETIKI